MKKRGTFRHVGDAAVRPDRTRCRGASRHAVLRPL